MLVDVLKGREAINILKGMVLFIVITSAILLWRDYKHPILFFWDSAEAHAWVTDIDIRYHRGEVIEVKAIYYFFAEGKWHKGISTDITLENRFYIGQHLKIKYATNNVSKTDVLKLFDYQDDVYFNYGIFKADRELFTRGITDSWKELIVYGRIVILKEHGLGGKLLADDLGLAEWEGNNLTFFPFNFEDNPEKKYKTAQHFILKSTSTTPNSIALINQNSGDTLYLDPD